jgi:hypothetical protein
LFDLIPPDATSIITVAGQFSADLSGDMRQLNPSGLATVFENNNSAIISAGDNPLADSQFEFNSSDAPIVIDVHESDSELRAALGGLSPMSTRFTLAHVVLAVGAAGTWEIAVVQRESGGINREYRQSGRFGFVGEGIPGDYNGNRTIEAADYVVWRKTLGQTGAGLAADGDGNQLIDEDDYAVWKAHFGQSHGDGLLTNIVVPEPSTCAIGCSVLLAAWRRRTFVDRTTRNRRCRTQRESPAKRNAAPPTKSVLSIVGHQYFSTCSTTNSVPAK